MAADTRRKRVSVSGSTIFNTKKAEPKQKPNVFARIFKK
jgi:hypothetical protein